MEEENEIGGFGMSFVDLLACGLGATIVLLLIFSKTLTFDSSASSSSNSGASKGSMSSFYSLTSDEKLEGKMVAIRMVGIKMEKRIFKKLKKHRSIGLWKYDTKLEPNVSKSIHYANNTMYFTLSSDTLVDPNLTFQIDESKISSKAERQILNHSCYAIGRIMEGAAFKDQKKVFSGFSEIGGDQSLKIQRIKDVKVRFKLGSAASQKRVESLIQIMKN